MIYLENEYVLICFTKWQDLKRVFDGGPWVILGHYLVVQCQQPEFFPFEDQLRKVAMWVTIPGLPIEYYDRHILWRIGNCLERTVKANSVTLRKSNMGGTCTTTRTKFARVCVEVVIHNVLVPTFELNDKVYKVEYEDLHIACFHCGYYCCNQYNKASNLLKVLMITKSMMNEQLVLFI